MRKPIRRNRERGQALILIALAVAGLLALTALAVDGSHVYAQLRQAQNAADTAAFAGAIARINAYYQDAPCDDVGIQSALQTAALDRAASNNFPNTPPSIDVTVNNPPDSTAPAAYIGDCTYVQVIIRAQVPTFFARIVGIETLPIHVQAVAKALPEIKAPVSPGNGLVGLGDVCGAVTVQGSSRVDITGGGIFTNSTKYGPVGGCYAFVLNASGNLQLYTPGIDAVGCTKPADIPYIHLPNGGSIDCSQQRLPYPMPVPVMDVSCTGSGSQDGTTLKPGNWSGSFPPVGASTLEPGIYCIHGDFVLRNQDDLTGDGVLFVVDGKVDWTGGKVHFTPITEAQNPDAANLLIYAPYVPGCSPVPSNGCRTVTVNGGASHNWRGTIFGPDSKCTISGESDGVTINAQVICYQIIVSGNASWDFNYNEGDQYNPTWPAETELNR